jgi:hypothetical protein
MIFINMLKVEGLARGVDWRSEHDEKILSNSRYTTTSVLSFKVETTENKGNIKKYVPVEMRGENIRGNISDGDIVHVRGSMKKGLLISKEVKNLTTNSHIVIQKRHGLKILKVILFVIFLIVFLFVLQSIVSSNFSVNIFPDLLRPTILELQDIIMS